MPPSLLFWIAAALVVAVTAYLVLVPLWRSVALRSRADSDVAVYRDQLDELERDLERGMLQEAEANAARTEISRRLLAADAARSSETSATPKAAAQFAVIMVVALPLLAVPLYLVSGTPGMPSQPFAERINKAPEDQTLEELVARVEEHLRTNPRDAEGWRVVAPIYARMGRFEDAASAFGRLIDLDGATAQRLADLGEAMVFADEGLVGDRAAIVFNEALRMDDQNPQARYFMGLASLQEGDRDAARTIWQGLAADADPNAPWARMVAQSLAALDAEPAPQTAQDAIANLPDAERAEAIDGMVARLDARLAEEGGSEADWLRLIRARLVLGQPEAAAKVLERGLANLADDENASARLAFGAQELGVTVPAGNK